MTDGWWKNAYVGQKVALIKLPTITAGRCASGDRESLNFQGTTIQIGEVCKIVELLPDSDLQSGLWINVGSICPHYCVIEYFCASLFRPLLNSKRVSEDA